ncbi:MAG TPA: helix-turn-helix domain-containing protein [Pyrinomonadaceae bacterium]|nr:helix-turn-helix domain-containing protein [Pyrinomonadaceae bacterium]
MTARQLAAILQVSESTVHRLARKGRIPSIRITPRITRFHLRSVSEALDGSKRSRRHGGDEAEDTAQLSLPNLFT